MKTSKFAISRGIFNVRDRGNKDGFPVAMLHGWPESSYCWEGVMAFLDPMLRVIAPDLRGLGDSERTLDVKSYQKLELAKDTVEVIDETIKAGHFLQEEKPREVALLMNNFFQMSAADK